MKISYLACDGSEQEEDITEAQFCEYENDGVIVQRIYCTRPDNGEDFVVNCENVFFINA